MKRVMYLYGEYYGPICEHWMIRDRHFFGLVLASSEFDIKTYPVLFSKN